MNFKALALLTFICLLFAEPIKAQQEKVIVASLTGTVGVQMEHFVSRVISHAEQEKAGLVIFNLDTPGGLVEATRGITQTILASKVPVVIWVPPGGRAASAGAFMMQAAHIAAMATGTNIGAAHPVVASGRDIEESDMKKKVTNDLLAQMRALTQLRGRNENTAQKMIIESLSLTAHEALSAGAIDIIADDMDSLLSAVNGRVVFIDGKSKTVRASSEQIEKMNMTLQEQLIQFLSSPDIAYLLLVGGLLALFYEIITPGGFILGITGAVMLLFGSIGLKMLPFNWAGVALVGAGIIVMGIDLLVGGMGILSILGIAVLVSGGIFLFQAPGGELLSVSLSVIIGMTVALGLSFALFALMISRSLRAPVTTGKKGLIGLEVHITEDLAPEGMVKCHGEVWKARAESTYILKDHIGKVVGVEGLTLVIAEKKLKVSPPIKDK